MARNNVLFFSNMKKIGILLLGWLVILNLFALFALNRLNLEPDTAYTWIDQNTQVQEQTWNLLPLHAEWDSEWYLDIAENGYSLEGDYGLKNIVFFPVYPFLLKLLGFLVGGNLLLAGVILSIATLYGTLLIFHRFIKEFHPDVDSYLPLLLMLIFPTAFFLNALYTESLFLLLSISSFYFGFKQKYGWASILGFIAALTRITGVLLFIPLAWEYGKQHRFRLQSMRKQPSGLLLFLIPLGTLSFFAFHWYRFGNFLLFLETEKAWGRAFTLNLDHFVLFSNPATANFLLDSFFAIFALTATVAVFWKLRTSYGLYMLATIGVAIGTGTLMSIGRYILVLFPIFILGALLAQKNEYFKYAWIFISLLLFSLYTILFVNSYWAG